MRRWRQLLGVACALALAVPAPAVAQPEATAASSTSAAAIDAGLLHVRQRLDRTQAASNRAEGDRRTAEIELVDAVVDRLVATEDLRQARHALAIARLERVAAARALATEQAVLADQIVETYRFGGPAIQAEMAWRIIQEARDPLEAARAVAELGDVVGFQADVVDARRRDHGIAVRIERRAVAAFNRAIAALGAAEQAEATAVDELVRQRTRTQQTENLLLSAIDNLFTAEQALIAEGHDPVEVLEASGLWLSILPALEDEQEQQSAESASFQSAAQDADEAPVAMAERHEWLENRLAALERQVSLTPADQAVRDQWHCPMAYGTYANDYHYPRSHGRRHKGLDMFATAGTPIMAIHSGFVVTRDEADNFNGEHDLGGVTVTIATRPEHPWRVDRSLLPEDDGAPVEEWYYAHMESIADGIRLNGWVEAGQIIGYVGDTGNARGTDPHLHLGWSVDNRQVNPFPSIAVACDPRNPAAWD